MCTVDNVAACLVQLSLGTQFKSKEFAGIYTESQVKHKSEVQKEHTRYHTEQLVSLTQTAILFQEVKLGQNGSWLRDTTQQL